MSLETENTGLEPSAYHTLTDEQLVLLAKERDPAAADELYHRYKNVVRGKARPYFLMGADREDLLQEGMIGFFKAVRDYDADKSTAFRPFAEMCVTRQIFTAIRNATRDKHIPLNSYESIYKPAYEESDKQLVDILAEATAPDPEELLLRSEYSSSIEKVLNEKLTKFELSVSEQYLSGLSYAEIAQKLGCSTKAVGNALHRMRKKLKEELVKL